MDTKRRLALKAVTWKVMGFGVMLLIGYIFTGSVSAGGGIAIAGTVVGFTTYFLHELGWSRISWGRLPE